MGSARVLQRGDNTWVTRLKVLSVSFMIYVVCYIDILCCLQHLFPESQKFARFADILWILLYSDSSTAFTDWWHSVRSTTHQGKDTDRAFFQLLPDASSEFEPYFAPEHSTWVITSDWGYGYSLSSSSTGRGITSSKSVGSRIPRFTLCDRERDFE